MPYVSPTSTVLARVPGFKTQDNGGVVAGKAPVKPPVFAHTRFLIDARPVSVTIDMLRKVKSRLRDFPQKHFFDFGDYRRTVFLAGTGRSGTTWLEEIINYDNSYRIMFEPFHALKVEMLKSWSHRQYLRSNNRSPAFLRPASAILSGRIRHPWIDAFNRKLLARKRLIKDIRCQLLLYWIKKNFPEIPIILLLRHPCAVASSKLKLGWDIDLDDFLSQDELITDWLHPFEAEIRKANTGDLFEKHIFLWCIQSYVPLKQFSQGDILVMFYEDICTDTHTEIERLFNFIGKRFSPQVFDSLWKPSALSRKDSAIRSGSRLTDAWRNNIDDGQIARAQEICELFGMHTLYGTQSSPLIKADDALKRR